MCDRISDIDAVSVVPGRMTGINYKRPAKRLRELAQMVKMLKGSKSTMLVDKYTNEIYAIYRDNNRPAEIDLTRFCMYEIA